MLKSCLQKIEEHPQTWVPRNRSKKSVTRAVRDAFLECAEEEGPALRYPTVRFGGARVTAKRPATRKYFIGLQRRHPTAWKKLMGAVQTNDMAWALSCGMPLY